MFQLATVTIRLPRVVCVTRVMVSAGMASSVTIGDHAVPGAPMSPRRIRRREKLSFKHKIKFLFYLDHRILSVEHA